MDSSEINSKLLDRAEEVVCRLFPSARKYGREMLVGGLSGEQGDSLKVCVEGAKCGFWADFASNDKGKTLTSLWCASIGGDFKKAMEQIRDYLGIHDFVRENSFYNAPKKVVKPVVESQSEDLDMDSPVARYLVEERGLDWNTLQKYRIGQTTKKNAVIFRSLSSDTKTLEMVKYLALEREDGKKKIWTSPNSSKVLFGKHAVAQTIDSLFITEGEIDCISMTQMGFSAVSVPFGAKNEGADGKDPNDEWIQNDFEWLESFPRIYLCFDADEPGQRAAKSIAKRLGQNRCYIVDMPMGCKDANEVLLKGWGADLNENVERAQTIDPCELKNADEFREDVWELFNPPSGQEPGIPFFIQKMPWRIRSSELTIWTGFSGSGKSEVIGNLIVYLSANAQKCCVASFEIPGARTIRNMAMQAAQVGTFKERPEFDQCMDWVRDHIWLIDKVGVMHWKKVIEIIRYARRRYGITQFVIDSLLRCGLDEDDYNGQKEFVNELSLLAIELEIHIHLVAHSRKRESEAKEAPNKHDVKGSGAITDLANNVMAVFRNKTKEAEIELLRAESGQYTSDQLEYKIERISKDKPDTTLTMHKQRETGEEKTVWTWFNPKTRTFRGNYDDISVRYA